MNNIQKCIGFIPSVSVLSYIPALAESSHTEAEERPNVIFCLLIIRV